MTHSSGQFVKHYLIYGSGVVLMNALPFFMIPIYTHAVDPSDYGVVELLNRGQELLLVILSLGLRSALTTFYQMERDNETRRHALYSTALQLLMVTTLIAVGVLVLFSGSFTRLLLQEQRYQMYVIIFLAGTYCEVLFQIAALYLQSELRSRLYVMTFAARALLSLTVNFLLVSVLKMGLKGIFVAMLIQTALSTLALLVYVFHDIGFRFNPAIIPGLLKFALPLVPAAIIMFVMNAGDRYFLNIFSTRDQVGIYGLGYRMGQIPTAFILMPFLKIWSVTMVDLFRRSDGPIQLGKVATYLIAALLFANVCLSLLSPYVIALIAAPEYRGAYKVVALVGASYLLYAWTTIMDASFYVTKRTTYKPLILGIAGVVVIALYGVLIPRFGVMGAAWGTLGGFSAFALATLFFAQRVYRIHYEWSRMARLLLVAIICYLSGAALAPFSLPSFFLRVGLVLAFAGLATTNLLSTHEERSYVAVYVRGQIRKLGSRGAETAAAKA